MSHHHHRSSKDENMDFDYLSPAADSSSSSSYYYTTAPAETPSPSFLHQHSSPSYSAEHVASPYSSSSYGSYGHQHQQPQHLFQTASAGNKSENRQHQQQHYPSVPRNLFGAGGEVYEPPGVTKGYSRTFSGNDLLADNLASGRCLRRFNSDVPAYCQFGTYNPFQGSPLEIANLSRLENRSPVVEEQPIQHQGEQSQHQPAEPVCEMTELLVEEPVEAVQMSNSKRSYKDVLTFPQQQRSDSPNGPESATANANAAPPVPSADENVVPSKPSSARKETYKDKLLSSKHQQQPQQESPGVSGKWTGSSSKGQSVNSSSGLNNHRSQPNTNPKRPLKINNNLSSANGGGGHKSGSKSAGASGEKNWHSPHNESVRSVRSQTDLGGGIGGGGNKKSNRNRPVLSSGLLDNGPSFEQLPPSDDEDDDDEAGVSPVEVRAVKDLRRSNNGKSAASSGNIRNRSEKENGETRSGGSNRSRHHKKNPPPSTGAKLARAYFPKLARLCCWVFLWLYNLCADVIQMSCDLSLMGIQRCRTLCWEKSFLATGWLKTQTRTWRQYASTHWLPSLREFFRFFRRRSSSASAEDSGGGSGGSGGLNANIPLPATGEEAMHRLLACKGRDPYSILGVRRDCSDEEIRRYYKRQAVLVHPDKNRQRGAEEAFKILAHAFELIGQPERRSHYDQLVAEADEMESAWAELNELLSKLHAKMDEAANTIRCTNCSKRHRRIKTERPCYAARYCQDCKIHHSAREGDLWAESRFMGFRSSYYACMEGAVYDITEWANCQAGHLRHLQSNSHRVQYRIVPGQAGGQPSHGGNGGNRKSS